VPFLVQEYIAGKNLKTFLADRYGKGQVFRGIPSADEWSRLAWKLVKRLNDVHQGEYVHRDIWPDNILVLEGEHEEVQVVFIDFGAAIYRHQLAIPPDPRRDRFVAPERKWDQLWPSRKFDVYALGGVFHYMATGLESPPPPIQDRDDLKDRVVSDICSHNPRLLTENAGIADIIARCLRYHPTERIRDADNLLNELQLFFAFEPELTLKNLIEELTQQAAHLNRGHDLFQQIAASELFQLNHRIASMNRGILDLSGDREEIVSGLSRYLSVLRKGDQYLAISVPECWSSGNLGINGRFLTMNRLLADRGVQIRRLFYVRETDFSSDAEFRRIAEAHLNMRNLCQNPNNIELRYKVLDLKDFDSSVRNCEDIGAWFQGESAIIIVPVYDHNHHMMIRQVRVRRYGGEAQPYAERLTRTIQGADTHPLHERFPHVA
jgi:serine/threonine protein kinase